jgi:hypothetical protein
VASQREATKIVEATARIGTAVQERGTPVRKSRIRKQTAAAAINPHNISAAFVSERLLVLFLDSGEKLATYKLLGISLLTAQFTGANISPLKWMAMANPYL